MDPANPPPAGTLLTVNVLTLIDQNDNNLINQSNNDSVNGSDIVSSWAGDTIRVNVPGVGIITYTGVTFYLANGQRVFTPTDGQVLQQGTFVSSTFVTSQGSLNVNSLGPPCFALGTLIETDGGFLAIEDLKNGSLVRTRDNGLQPIRWIGKVRLDAGDLARTPALRPVRIRAGALSKDVPSQDLVVSPQHRILVRSAIALKMFGVEEILVAAKQLVEVEGIELASDMQEVVYFHILFDRHEVVNSNGADTESLFTGPEALKSVGREALDEILALFPELAEVVQTPPGAREFATGRRGRRLAERHARNSKPLVMRAE